MARNINPCTTPPRNDTLGFDKPGRLESKADPSFEDVSSIEDGNFGEAHCMA